MANHNLWLGGETHVFQGMPHGKQFPAAPLDPCYPYRVAEEFAGATKTYSNEINTCENKHFTDLIEYFDKYPVQVGDYINLLPIPLTYNLKSIYWELIDPLPGFTGELDVCGLDGSTIYVDPIPWDLGASIGGKDELGNPLLNKDHRGSAPVNVGVPGAPCIDGFMHQIGMLRLKVNTIPDDAASLCDPCATHCFAFVVSATVCDNCNMTRRRPLELGCDTETHELTF